ncbi:unnamed protein product [Pleuronectes platessa]|uniref:Uncharacterized protein n=1 Tax=Pleuronectes platessa TaxID=8262 RepID=A0A9N7W4T7_PLEPL|nr:unnamed protein product [Pleuronectes platessa]
MEPSFCAPPHSGLRVPACGRARQPVSIKAVINGGGDVSGILRALGCHSFPDERIVIDSAGSSSDEPSSGITGVDISAPAGVDTVSVWHEPCRQPHTDNWRGNWRDRLFQGEGQFRQPDLTFFPAVAIGPVNVNCNAAVSHCKPTLYFDRVTLYVENSGRFD